MKRIVVWIGMVLALSGLAHADLIGKPKPFRPGEGTLTGTLAWVSEGKDQVCLKDAGGGVTSLGMVTNLPKTVVCDKLIDKRVVVKFITKKNPSGATVAGRVTDIKAAPLAKR